MFYRFLLGCFIQFLATINCVFASNLETSIIADLRKPLSSLVEVNDFTLLSGEFKEYYKNQVTPNLDSLYSKIRIIPVNIKDDEKTKEAILVGDTARNSVWGIKNFIAVAAMVNSRWHLMTFKEIKGNISCDKQSKCKFDYYWQKLNPKSPNRYIGAMIGYANYGVSGHSFIIQTIGWNRYDDEYYINTISAPVPLRPDNNFE